MSATVEFEIDIRPAAHGRKRLRQRKEKPTPPPPKTRVPRVARLVALAFHYQGLIDRGEVRDYAEIARLGGVTRARVTQIMALLSLAPDLLEEILFLPPAVPGRESITERQIRRVVALRRWDEQRRVWQAIREGRE